MTTMLTPAMRRSALIAMLRDRRLWPEGFSWNFQSCQTCARGLAHEMLGLKDAYSSDELKELFGLTQTQIWQAFANNTPDGTPSYQNIWNVPPEMVADQLEEIHLEIGDE